MSEERRANDSLLISYHQLRKAVGLLGFVFPFVLAVAGALFEPGIRETISDYYHHREMRDIFVGTLCAISVFLLTYRGYTKADDTAGNIACFFGVGVALFPTAPDDPTPVESMIGILHYGFAARFFLTLAYFSLRLFTKTDQENPTPRKLQRNRVYRACGYVMLGALVSIAILAVLPDPATEPIAPLAPVFWLEAFAVLAFGISWLVKGEALLRDEA